MSRKVKELPLPKREKKPKVKLTAEQRAERRVQSMKDKEAKLEMQLEEQKMESDIYEQGGPKAVSLFRRWRLAIHKVEQLRQRLLKLEVVVKAGMFS